MHYAPTMTIPNRMQAHWEKAGEFIKKEWPLLSDTAIRRIHGNFDLFLKYLKDTYDNFPLEEARARDKIQRFLNTLE